MTSSACESCYLNLINKYWTDALVSLHWLHVPERVVKISVITLKVMHGSIEVQLPYKVIISVFSLASTSSSWLGGLLANIDNPLPVITIPIYKWINVRVTAVCDQIERKKCEHEIWPMKSHESRDQRIYSISRDPGDRSPSMTHFCRPVCRLSPYQFHNVIYQWQSSIPVFENDCLYTLRGHLRAVPPIRNETNYYVTERSNSVGVSTAQQLDRRRDGRGRQLLCRDEPAFRRE